MECPGNRLAALAVVVLLPACRLHYDLIERGTRRGWSDYEAVVVGTDDRGAVLDKLGPPDEVWYTLDSEVFEYRAGGHRGSDLRFLVPLDLPIPSPLSPLRAVLSFLTPSREEPEEFQEEPLVVRATDTVIGRLVGIAPTSVSSFEIASLYGRRLRHDVLRIQLDRHTHLARAKQLLLGVDLERESLTRSTFLLEDDSTPAAGEAR